MSSRTRIFPVSRAGFLLLALVFLATLVATDATAQRPRARDLGVPFDGRSGPLNAITDVAGVEVGHTTLISGSGERIVGEGPVRTGVTAVLPRGDDPTVPVFASWFTLNGNGEMTGTTWVEDSGLLEGPIMITNTLSVGVVHHAVIRWGVEKAAEAGEPFGPRVAELPIVAETWDGALNDIHGQHVTEEHALHALETASGGPVAEGSVGGGTGMRCHQFKAGIGTSSRRVEVLDREYTVGVLVQCNYGSRDQLRIAGAPVGREIPDMLPGRAGADGGTASAASDPPSPDVAQGRDGSIIAVVATDAPLIPPQLKRIARRVSLALGRLGSVSTNGSGDIFVAFSTANREAARGVDRSGMEMLPNGAVSPLFAATVQATEEAIVNALVAGETMTGADDYTIHALPHDRLREALRKYGRLVEPGTE